MVARVAPRPVPDVLAAVDLGSNSFHMVVARHTHGQLVGNLGSGHAVK